MEQQELELLMKESAQNAVETAKTVFDIELDFTRQSVQLVDDIILMFLEKFKDEALEDTAVFTICNIYGAYLGEVFRQELGGLWKYENADSDEPHVLLALGDRAYAFAGICYQRLVNDSQISVYRYFEKARQNHTN
ncbi:hypothetical protein [Salinimonas chungwhensis]|uniref:hypothetical protein n=1 Tax=Salinimonas chungwhensis TaxID=265425 RepID=UPI000374CD27|nr:hypothetical protein [Salinimonas chungwhensis]